MKIVVHRSQFPCCRPGALFGLAAAMTILPAALAHAAVPTVAIKDGNVVLTDNGQQRQLTKSGKDADPVLSPDGKWVAFTRVNNPGSTGSQGDCKSGAMADELRRTGTNGSGDELLVRGQDSSDPKGTLCDFSHKQFTSDGRYIFFLSRPGRCRRRSTAMIPLPRCAAS